MTSRWWSRLAALLLSVAFLPTLAGCGWRGLNSLPLPGTEGGGTGAFVVQAQMPDVSNLQPNSPVNVDDVAVGSVSKIERQGWHALVTMRLNGDVHLPANATVTLAQTSLLATLHLALAPPVGIPPQGELTDGSVIPLASAGAYPDTEQTLAMLSMLLNGGGVGQIQDITQAFSTAFVGRESDLRSLVEQLDRFVGYLNDQKDDIIAATDSLNQLVGKFAANKPVVDRAIRTIPQALAVLSDQRDNLNEALDQFGKLSALTADSVDKTKTSLVQEFKDVGPVLESLANAGPAMTRSLDVIATFPWIKGTLGNWVRGDYANLSAVFDLTLSRLDTGLFTGTRWEGNMTKLEMYWGRTIGQLPSPVTARNPLVVPYQLDQGP
ncbi:MCE family protein [Mycobacterium sp. AZCC_0083]|uniref:MCE family protein n=1 Tax=Mycobacterium sp. AZCC_0083 TaxID=2735882 RepID=UPI001613FF8E|nr:MCE family protein [Mycobacterium sp. AZCC_0083]MBB5167858.1 phospholipid/cholesterol/gamma-HCH transport system substrate-binding protein [Mycobacterium sp. AZCC_0083]